MIYNLAYAKEDPAIAGKNISMRITNGLQDELKFAGDNSGIGLVANLHEYRDFFKINILIPDITPGDIYVRIREHFLFIRVLKKRSEIFNKTRLQIIEFEDKCRPIKLPSNASAMLWKVTYKMGLLSVFVPKVEAPVLQITA